MIRWWLFLALPSLLLLLNCGSSQSGPQSPSPPQPPPGISSFAHIVVIIQENRTPDNLFQSMAASGADISPNGICYNGATPCAGADSNGVLPLASSPMAAHYDPLHNNSSWVTDFHSGAMDNFNASGCAGNSCPTTRHTNSVQASDIQPYIELAQTYAFADRMFQTNKDPSVPGHLYLSWGTSRLSPMSTVLDSDNSHGYCANPSTGAGTWPTIDQQSGAMGTNTACVEYPSLITDQLEAKSLTWK